YVVDVTATLVVVDHAANRQRVRNQGQVEHGRDVGIGVATGRDPVTGGDTTLGHVDLRFVRDVANRAGLGPRAEQGSLGPFEDFNALEVRRVNIEIPARELAGLVVQIDRHVRKPADGAAGLGPVAADTEASHEDLRLARAR